LKQSALPAAENAVYIPCPKSEHWITLNITTNAKLYGTLDSAARVFSYTALIYARLEWCPTPAGGLSHSMRA